MTSSPDNKLRVAIIGTGFFSPFHFDAWSRVPDASLVAAVAKSNQERAVETAGNYGVSEVFMDVDDMLDQVEPDLVDIVTPPRSHLPIVQQVSKRGVPMLLQKPIAPDLPEATELVEVAERAGALLVINENWRFRPWFREVKAIMDSGVIGTPEMIRFTFRPGDGRGPDAFMDRQPRFRDMERFLIHETGVHMLDSFRYLVGEVTRVFAQMWRRNPVIQGEDQGYVLFDFENDVHGLFDGNRLGGHDAEYMRLTTGHLLLEGSDASVRSDGEGRIWILPNRDREYEHRYEFSKQGFGGDSVRALHEHVAKHLLYGDTLENTGREYLTVSYIEDAIYQSDETESWVTVSNGRG